VFKSGLFKTFLNPFEFFFLFRNVKLGQIFYFNLILRREGSIWRTLSTENDEMLQVRLKPTLGEGKQAGRERQLQHGWVRWQVSGTAREATFLQGKHHALSHGLCFHAAHLTRNWR
jgi:hypothetical protein